MKISRQVGTTNEVLSVFLRDVTSVSSKGLANVSSTSVNFTWMRNDQAAVSSGMATAGGTLGTYSVSTLTEMSSSLALGWYHFCPPNGLFASGRSAILHIYGYPNLADTPIEIELTKSDNQVYVSTVNVLGLVNPIGVSTGAIGVSSASIPFGVSSISTPVGVSSSIMVSSNAVQMNGTTILGTGTAGDLWRG